MGNIEGLSFLGETSCPQASVGRLRERSMGKDTTIGHWELAGHISEEPLPVFPKGFPNELLESLSRKTGREILCNKPYSGTDVIRDYGEEHLRTGALIVYTSADSVLQIAAHTSVIPLNELYGICEIARELCVGTYGVGRVIARPFEGSFPEFQRTADRRDYSLNPPVELLPDVIQAWGLDSIAVGKISDIFGGRGFTKTVRTHSNREGMEITAEIAREGFHGLCFVNLVDFDSKWGHRRDAIGYAEGLNEFDRMLGELLPLIGEEDLLMITADHGCDPGFGATTDHTREYVPILMYGGGESVRSIGTRESFADVAATVADRLGVTFACDGRAIQ